MDFRRLAGLTEDYSDWKRENQETTLSLAQIHIRKMAGMLEDERFGASHLPTFDWKKVEALMEAALAPDNVHPRDPAHASHKEAAKTHWDARIASAKAHELDKGRDSYTSHKAHGEAAHTHRVAAHLLRAAGDHEFADTHEKWAEHHTMHAHAHANILRGKHGRNEPSTPEPEPDPFPPKKKATDAGAAKAPPAEPKALPAHKPEPEKKTEKPAAAEKPVDKAPAKAEAPKAEPAKLAKSGKKKVKPTSPAPGERKVLDKEWEARRAASKKDEHPVVTTAKNHAKAAMAGDADSSVSGHELAKLYHHAAKAKMAQAAHHFDKGEHDKALAAFNSAIYHKGKAAKLSAAHGKKKSSGEKAQAKAS